METCNVVRVARVSMTPEEVAANVATAIEGVAANRMLCDSFDAFFADKGAFALLPKLLVKGFFKKMENAMVEDTSFEDDQLASMTTDDSVRACRLLDNEIRILKASPSPDAAGPESPYKQVLKSPAAPSSNPELKGLTVDVSVIDFGLEITRLSWGMKKEGDFLVGQGTSYAIENSFSDKTTRCMAWTGSLAENLTEIKRRARSRFGSRGGGVFLGRDWRTDIHGHRRHREEERAAL